MEQLVHNTYRNQNIKTAVWLLRDSRALPLLP